MLSKLHSIGVRQDRGSIVFKEAEVLFNNFVKQTESIFNNLPKPLKQRSFRMHDLVLLIDISLKVQKASGRLLKTNAQLYNFIRESTSDLISLLNDSGSITLALAPQLITQNLIS